MQLGFGHVGQDPGTGTTVRNSAFFLRIIVYLQSFLTNFAVDLNTSQSQKTSLLNCFDGFRARSRAEIGTARLFRASPTDQIQTPLELEHFRTQKHCTAAHIP